MKIHAVSLAIVLLSGCAYNLTMMPRDSGQTYTGKLTSPSGNGSGTMTVAIGDLQCSGPAARVASNQTFGFVNTFGSSGVRTFNSFSTMSTSGDVQVKAILSCTGGKGLRCDLTGRGSSGGGICVDDAGRVFDVLATLG